MFGIKVSDMENLVKTNYILLVIEGLFIYILARYNIMPVGVVIFGVSSILGANIILHLLLKFKAKTLILEIGMLFCSLVVLSTIATCIYFLSPAVMPATLLIFIPAIFLSASLSFSFGMTYLVTVTLAVSILYWLGIHNFPDLFDRSVKFQFIFNSFFIVILGFLASSFMQILRKKEKRIAELYQMSKTTSDEIVKNMKEALVVIDSKLKIIRHNDAFIAICKTKEVINKSIKEINLPFDFNITEISSDILDNDIKSTINITKEDRSKNQYEIAVNKTDLKDSDYGFIVIINIKQSPWGTVFDSETKKPINLALVRLMNVSTKRITETKVTDENGNFGFMVQEGKFSLIVSKNGYSYPSKTNDGYRGEEFSSAGNLIKLEIPVDKIDK